MDAAMEIIKARVGDIDEIVKQWREFMDFHNELNPNHPRREDAHEIWKAFLISSMESDQSLVLVCLDHDKIVAFSLAHIKDSRPIFKHERYGFISDFSVKEQNRRNGIGEKMLAKIQEWFHEHGVSRIELRVEPRNKIGYSFWKKHGFSEHVHVLFHEE